MCALYEMMPAIKKIDTADLINPVLNGLTESDTLRINDWSKELISEGRTVFRFGLGQSPFPVPDVIIEALRMYAPQKDYLPVRGLPMLREAVADFHRRKDGINAGPDCVMVGPGSKELLFLLQLVFNGETIIVSPCWVSYVPQAIILGKKISTIHSSFVDKWQLTPDLFRQFIQERENPGAPAILILNYPGNPDGVSFKETALKEIAQIARENNIFILSDEIYGQLHHQGKHVSIARYYPEGTIISSGLSKWCGAGGWRLGTFTFPNELKWLLDKMAIVASETYTSVSAPVQYAAVQAFKGGSEIEDYLHHARRILSNIGNDCADLLNNAGIRTHPPVGGFYLFLDFSAFADKLISEELTTSSQFCDMLLDRTGVALLPGSSFGRTPGEFTARLAYVDFDGAAALSASKSIPFTESLPADFATYYYQKTMEGVKRIIGWLESLG